MEESKLKIGLFNVTSLHDKNPGCRATVEGLKTAINEELLYQIPLGFGYQYFNLVKKTFILRKSSSYTEQYTLFKSNPDYISLLTTLDVIIINAEGTIHSDKVGAKALLSFVKLGKQLKKRVYIVNGSYYNLSDNLLTILKSADKIFVRERASYDYLMKNEIKSFLVYDCAFLTKYSISNKISSGCLYTPGVFFTYGKERNEQKLLEIIKGHFESIEGEYEKPVFLLIDKLEFKFADYWIKLGGEVIDATSLSVEELLQIISEYELVISGRYHILLFALMANCKTIPLESNSNKIMGLYYNFSDSDIIVQDSLRTTINLEKKIKLQVDLDIIVQDIVSAYAKLLS